MKLLGRIIKIQTKTQKRKTLAQYQRELLIRQTREQFQMLVDRGLRLPVA